MGSKGTPKPPDPYKTASTEAQFNNTDTYGPGGGGVRYGYTDANGTFQQGKAPEGMQSAQSYQESDFEKAMRAMMEPASQQFAGQMITDNVTNLPGPAQVQDRSDVASDIFNKNMSLMQPTFEQENARMLSNVQARGLPIGSKAFENAYGQQQTQVNEAISRAAMDANIGAGQEQSRQFGLDSAARSNSISELMALMGGGYQPASAVPSGDGANIDYGNLTAQEYQAQVAAQQAKAQTMGSMGSLAGGLLMKCTAAAKTKQADLDILHAEYVVQHIPLHVWRYLDGQAPPGFGSESHIGPMAEDFHALTRLGTPQGINIIDYLGLLMGALQGALHRIEVLEHQAAGGSIQ